jgi:hypothetical protein
MVGHPNFPRTELRHLATAPAAADRALATLDPGTAPETIEALSHDPEPRVRRAAARDARLGRTRLLTLLDDPETAEDAAANPALPPEVMDHLFTTLLPRRSGGGRSNGQAQGPAVAPRAPANSSRQVDLVLVSPPRRGVGIRRFSGMLRSSPANPFGKPDIE